MTLTIELPQQLSTELQSRQLSPTLVETFVIEAVQRWLDIGATDPTQLEMIFHPAIEDDETLIESLSDQQVLALCDLQWSPQQQAVLNNLLERNGEGQLGEADQQRLDTLMAQYDRDSLHKAHALTVAVKRGLRLPLNQ